MMKLSRFQQVTQTHRCVSALSMSEPTYQREVLRYTVDALKADLGKRGDLTTAALEIGAKKVRAQLICKSGGVLAGRGEVEFFLNLPPSRLSRKLLGKVKIRFLKKDGEILQKNKAFATLEGCAADILAIERTLLNFLQRMSGVATLTAQFVKQVPAHVLIVPTRKTLWGLLDKKACVVGGGGTHRIGLGDAILVKDTHCYLLKNDWDFLWERLSKVQIADRGRFVEIEVENFKQAVGVVSSYQSYRKKYPYNAVFHHPLYLMFDNMKLLQIQEILNYFKKQELSEDILFEASGGINLQNVKAYAHTGVDILSVGALTHSAPALDISLRII